MYGLVLYLSRFWYSTILTKYPPQNYPPRAVEYHIRIRCQKINTCYRVQYNTHLDRINKSWFQGWYLKFEVPNLPLNEKFTVRILKNSIYHPRCQLVIHHLMPMPQKPIFKWKNKMIHIKKKKWTYTNAPYLNHIQMLPFDS